MELVTRAREAILKGKYSEFKNEFGGK